MPLCRTELTGEVVGPVGTLLLRQTFGFSAAQCDRVVEAFYRFPLPGDAAVISVHVRLGDVDISAELKERPEAERDYEKARAQGRQAALLTRESPDVFTLQIAGLAPNQQVLVETRYIQLARPAASGWSLRIPLTTAPRYVRSDEVTGRHAHGQPLALLRDPGHRFHLDLLVRGAGQATSPTHSLDVTSEPNGLRLRLQGSEVLPDRDCVLTWTPLQESHRPTLQVWLHDDRKTNQVYFLALVAPPATHDRGRGVPREVILLVDHSGSMQGAKWQAADWAVEKFLADLTERDLLALCLFHDTTCWLADHPRLADPKAVGEAVAFLQAHRDSGGTELGVALEQALSQVRASGELARHVLIVTDVEVCDAGRILRLAEAESRLADRRRISLLCIDSAPNALLATDLAEQGGGVARFLTSRPDEEDIATALDEILADWGEPVLTGLRLEVNRPHAEADHRAPLGPADGGTALDLGDLPAGRPVWLVGRVPHGETGELAFRLRTARGMEVAAHRLTLPPKAESRPALKALFGARRVRGLENLIHSGLTGDPLEERLQALGYDPALVRQGRSNQPAPVYAENARAEATAALRELLVLEALNYGLASMETAFVAVRTEPGKPVRESVIVANALPAGWSEGFLGVGPDFIADVSSICCMASPPSPRFWDQAGGFFARIFRAKKKSYGRSLDASVAQAFIGALRPCRRRAVQRHSQLRERYRRAVRLGRETW